VVSEVGKVLEPPSDVEFSELPAELDVSAESVAGARVAPTPESATPEDGDGSVTVRPSRKADTQAALVTPVEIKVFGEIAVLVGCISEPAALDAVAAFTELNVKGLLIEWT